MIIQLLRIEAINLSYIIDDTEDLSTRRGGGYMLLQAVRDIKKSNQDKIEPISTGASIGLFKVKNEINPHDLITETRDFLNKNSAYRHATFSVTVVQGQDNEFRMLVEKSISNVRWHQMQSLNFKTYWENANEVCSIDEVRPAPIPLTKELNISHSVNDRRKSGRELRQAFYQYELNQETGLVFLSKDTNTKDDAFTNDTETLSKFDPEAEGYASIPANLNGKMAVFYADGNSFGKLQKNCRCSKDLEKLDEYIKCKQRKLLAELLRFIQSTPLGKITVKEKEKDIEKLRFETLLWGGDEMLFILPAWLGIEFSQKFLAFTEKWNQEDRPLSYAVGLVFSSHSAPISQLQKLAKKLAEYGKATDRKRNTLSWVVLESFDHAGDNMDNYWQRNAINQNGWQKLLLNQDKLEALLDGIAPIKNELPRSAMVRVIRSLAAGKAGEENELTLLQRSYDSVNTALNEKTRPGFETLWKNLTGNSWDKAPTCIPPEDAIAWTILLELWDYLPQDTQPEQARVAQ